MTKLYSCAAALAELGPAFKFQTPVYRRGEVARGRLKGDLILQAQGDLALGGRTDASGNLAFRDHDHIYAGFADECDITETDPLAGLKDLARQVRKAGITHVEGDVLIDDRLFEKNRGSGSGPARQSCRASRRRSLVRRAGDRDRRRTGGAELGPRCDRGRHR